MQATSPTYRPPVGSGWLTTTSLVLIVILAVIVLAAIVHGMRLAAQRRAARKIEDERVEAEASATAEPSRPSEPELVRVEREARPTASQPSIAPEVVSAPPPLDPGPAPGTPAADPFPAAPDLTDEPVAAAAPLDASPAVEAESAPSGPPAGDRPLTTLKGLGPKVAARLEELGIATVADLATLDDAQAQAIDARLGPFTGRMARDRWLDQARLLAAGNDKGFEAQFGRL